MRSMPNLSEPDMILSAYVGIFFMYTLSLKNVIKIGPLFIKFMHRFYEKLIE
ncbi:hypothetical protein GCM10007362_48520 [Saccharibacillus endophyticus]|uniref:Uncharacterized protein n=1 Tax=Saccharibacillus endophyticus TaxID=2060666 RepID=A0ABQ2A6Q3_9BACL|nr:hypothetical protein GCM10007362_48520 [Saccharibacillus endophyticus]